MYLPTPYSARNFQDVNRLEKLGYPIEIVRLVYPEFEETVCDSDVLSEIWMHPGQINGCHRRSKGHDILRELLRTSNLCRAASFHVLRYYIIYPAHIPREWYNYTHIIAWKGVAYNEFGDMVVPALYTKSPQPTIHWIPLFMIMHAGEGTLLLKR